jgi:hypothetical protein
LVRFFPSLKYGWGFTNTKTKAKIMTEYELQKLGFSRVYLDENSDKIDKPVNSNGIYFFYELEIENLMTFHSNGIDELVNNNWVVDFGFRDDWEMNGFKIDSYDAVKKIIDLFQSIKLN